MAVNTPEDDAMEVAPLPLEPPARDEEPMVIPLEPAPLLPLLLTELLLPVLLVGTVLLPMVLPRLLPGRDPPCELPPWTLDPPPPPLLAAPGVQLRPTQLLPSRQSALV